MKTHYNVSCDLFHEIESFDGYKYICFTCDKHLKKDKTPPQAVTNKLELDTIPAALETLNRLEKTLISKRILLRS